MAPGQSTRNFFVCVGKVPDDESHLPVKKNYPINIIVALSVLVYSYAGARTLHFKYRARKQEQGHSNTNNFGMDSQTLFSFTTNGTILLLLLACLVMPIKVNKMDFIELGTYPNYIWFYAMQNFTPSSTIAMTVIIYYMKTPTLRKHVLIELKARISILKSYKLSSNRVYSIKIV